MKYTYSFLLAALASTTLADRLRVFPKTFDPGNARGTTGDALASCFAVEFTDKSGNVYYDDCTSGSFPNPHKCCLGFWSGVNQAVPHEIAGSGYKYYYDTGASDAYVYRDGCYNSHCKVGEDGAAEVCDLFVEVDSC